MNKVTTSSQLSPAVREQLNAMLMPPSLARLQTGGTAKPWYQIDGATFRPGYNLTPARLWSIFRAAEVGQPAAQCDTFEDLLENDGHMRGQYESRMGSVAFRPWILQPGAADDDSRAAARDLTIALRTTNMPSCLWHMQQALGYGWSGINIAWQFAEDTGIVAPHYFLCAPHRRFIADMAGQGDMRFLTPEQSAQGVPLLPGEWIVPIRPHRMFVRAGFFRTTSWWALFKRMSITDWIVFAEKFGVPLVIGHYEERASPEARAALMQAVTDIGSDGQAVLSEFTKIVIENQATRYGDVAALHPTIAARCDAEISKVITGATLNVETGGPGSFALGKVHEGRAVALQYADAFWVQNTFNDAVCLPFVRYNARYKKAAPPQLQIRVQPDMDPLTEVKVYSQLQLMGLEIEDEQMRERFGLRRPELGGVLKPLYAPPQAPAPKAGATN